MKNRVKFMFSRAWDLLFSTKQTWENIKTENKGAKDIRKFYVFPWIIICILVSFFAALISADIHPFEKAFVDLIITSLALFGGYFLTNKICFRYFSKEYPNTSSDTVETVIAYSFTTIFLLQLVISIFSSLFFLQIFSIHVAYLVWEGSGIVFKIEEEKKGNIVLVFTLAIIFIPIVIDRVIHWMLPNI